MRYKVTVYFKMPDITTILPQVNQTKMERFLKREKLLPTGVQVFREMEFDSEASLYYYVRGYDYVKRDGANSNHILEAIMTSPNDNQRHRILFDDTRYNRKQLKGYNDQRLAYEYYYLGYLINDETGRTLDLRNYEKELYHFDYSGYVKALREKRRLEFDEWRIQRDAEYDKNYWLRGGDKTWGYRNMRTTQERRYACDREHLPYIRGKRRHLPDPWGAEKLICREKTWKARTKVRRQWQVNLLLHIDTVRYEKRAYDKELLLENDDSVADVYTDNE